MATSYICSYCGNVQASWYGKCPDCGEWNTLKKFNQKNTEKAEIKDVLFQSLEKIETSKNSVSPTGIFEVDRVIGGGIAENAVILLAGEPGIGKSSLLLQLASGNRVMYISGEESI
ncbi:MAG: ATPase domain-containing protein, partial [Candidatus Roizmanbacteria bacterium]